MGAIAMILAALIAGSFVGITSNEEDEADDNLDELSKDEVAHQARDDTDDTKIDIFDYLVDEPIDSKIPDTEQNEWIEGSEDDDKIFGGSGDDLLRGLGGDDNIQGGQGHDLIEGGLGTDVLNGSSGNDILVGIDFSEPGNANDDDTLFGGTGDDVLIVGSNDTATGGTGNDFFVSGDWIGNDPPPVITDFETQQDKLVIYIESELGPQSEIGIQPHDGITNVSNILLDGKTIAIVKSDAELGATDLKIIFGNAEGAFNLIDQGDWR